jgi:hypothetical protein
MRQSESINELVAALTKVQGMIEPPQKGKTAHVKSDKANYTFDYADLAAVIASVRKPLSECGIAYTFAVDIVEGKAILDTRIMHTSGQWIGSVMPLTVAGTPQQRGSEITYLKRYSLCGLIGVAAEDEDDDGNAASGNRANIAPRQQTQRPTQQQQKPTHQQQTKTAQTSTTAAGNASTSETQKVDPGNLGDNGIFAAAVAQAYESRKISNDLAKEITAMRLYRATNGAKTELSQIPTASRQAFIDKITSGAFDNYISQNSNAAA